jgi:hypothetical protein
LNREKKRQDLTILVLHLFLHVHLLLLVRFQLMPLVIDHHSHQITPFLPPCGALPAPLASPASVKGEMGVD